MFTDQPTAAAAWRIIHDGRRSMAATAKVLGVGTLDVGTIGIALTCLARLGFHPHSPVGESDIRRSRTMSISALL